MKTDTRQHFGSVVRARRKKAGMSLRRFAQEVGLSPGYISLMETGKASPPKDEKIEAIAQVLKIAANELLHDAGRVPLGMMDALERKRFFTLSHELAHAVLDVERKSGKANTKRLHDEQLELLRRIVRALSADQVAVVANVRELLETLPDLTPGSIIIVDPIAAPTNKNASPKKNG